MGRATSLGLHGREPQKFFDALGQRGREWFAYLLARQCGTWDVDGLLASIPAWQFERWYQLYQRQPWGEERTDLAAGVQIMYAEAHRGIKPKQPAEYMPYLRRAREAEKPMSEETIVAAFTALAKSLGSELVPVK